MGAPGTAHPLRHHTRTPDPDRMALMNRLDPSSTTDPHQWTIDGGRPLNEDELDLAHHITKADALHYRDVAGFTGERKLPEGVQLIGNESQDWPIIITNDEPPAA